MAEVRRTYFKSRDEFLSDGPKALDFPQKPNGEYACKKEERMSLNTHGEEPYLKNKRGMSEWPTPSRVEGNYIGMMDSLTPLLRMFLHPMAFDFTTSVPGHVAELGT